MRTTGLVVVVVVAVGGLGCFSTARYEDAHIQRVASINARYEAERTQAQQREAELTAALEADRRLLAPTKPGSRCTPLHRVDEREAIVECRDQCERRAIDESLDGYLNEQIRKQCVHEICEPAYVDALTKTYVDADVHWVTSQLAASENADLESLMAFSHNQQVSRHLDDEARGLAKLQAQVRQQLERDRQAEIAASAWRRDQDIASGRAAHRARVQAAAFAARDAAPIDFEQSSLCTEGDPRLSRITGCRVERPLPDLAPTLEHAEPRDRDR